MIIELFRKVWDCTIDDNSDPLCYYSHFCLEKFIS